MYKDRGSESPPTEEKIGDRNPPTKENVSDYTQRVIATFYRNGIAYNKPPCDQGLFTPRGSPRGVRLRSKISP